MFPDLYPTSNYTFIYPIIIRISITTAVCIKFVIVIDLYNLLGGCLDNRRGRRGCEGRRRLLRRSFCRLPFERDLTMAYPSATACACTASTRASSEE